MGRWTCCAGGHDDVRFIETDATGASGRRPDPDRPVRACGRRRPPDPAGRGRRSGGRGPGRPGPAPAALCPPARAVRGAPVGAGGGAVADRGHSRLCRGRGVVSGPPVAGDGQRLRHGPLQRRHRGDREHSGRGPGGVRPRRGGDAVPAGSSRRDPDRARHDGAPGPGQSVRDGVVHRARGRVAPAHPRAALHRGHPGVETRAGVRHRGGHPPRDLPAGQPGQRAGQPAGDGEARGAPRRPARPG